LLTLDEVAERLRRSPAQLRWMRHNGTGPRSAKISGRIFYPEQEVEDWIDAQFAADEKAGA
jgi:predicted DNA-binding transcriptional regulator AlpA